jgi:hypothetical protein
MLSPLIRPSATISLQGEGKMRALVCPVGPAFPPWAKRNVAIFLHFLSKVELANTTVYLHVRVRRKSFMQRKFIIYAEEIHR